MYRTCKDCGVEKKLDNNNFPTSGPKNGKTYYRHRCKACHREIYKKRNATIDKETKRARDIASQRARTRLARAMPELFDVLMEQELRKLGYEYKKRYYPKKSKMDMHIPVRSDEG